MRISLAEDSFARKRSVLSRWRLNWFECSSMTPPHSGQRQFTMADCTFSFDRFELSDYIQLLQSTEIPVFRYQSLGNPPARRSFSNNFRRDRISHHPFKH